MSTDKQDFALYYEAKNDKVRKRLSINAGFSGPLPENYLSQFHAALLQWTILATTKMILKPVRVNLPVVDDLPPEGVFDTEFCNRYEKGGRWHHNDPDFFHQQRRKNRTTNTNVNGEAAVTASNDNDEQSGAQPENTEKSKSHDSNDDCHECEIPVATLSLTHRFLHLYFSARKKTENTGTTPHRNNAIQ